MTRNELLVILVEECGEIIQAATKCLRFGYDRHEPEYGVNSEVLAVEVGDLLGVVDALAIDPTIIQGARSNKVARVTRRNYVDVQNAKLPPWR